MLLLRGVDTRSGGGGGGVGRSLHPGREGRDKYLAFLLFLDEIDICPLRHRR